MKRPLVPLILGILVAVAGCGQAALPKPSNTAKSTAQAAAPAASTASTTSTASAASTAPAASTGTATAKHVTLILDWQIEGYQAPFFLGVAKGFYKQHGLDVKIIPGKGSLSTVQQIGHGNYDFGFADSGTAATAITKGIPVKVVAGYIQNDPNSVITLAKEHITKPSGLVGKTIGTSAGSASQTLFPAFLKANHLQQSQMRMENMASDAKVGALESGRVNGILDWGFEVLPELAAKHFQGAQLNYGDWGVPALGPGLIVNTAYLKSHASTVKAFVAASDQAWTYAQTHQAAAIAAEKANASNVPPGSAQVLKLTYGLVHTANSKGKPIGWMSPKDWQGTLATLEKYEGLSSPKPVNVYYTDSFVQGG